MCRSLQKENTDSNKEIIKDRRDRKSRVKGGRKGLDKKGGRKSAFARSQNKTNLKATDYPRRVSEGLLKKEIRGMKRGRRQVQKRGKKSRGLPGKALFGPSLDKKKQGAKDLEGTGRKGFIGRQPKKEEAPRPGTGLEEIEWGETGTERRARGTGK